MADLKVNDGGTVKTPERIFTVGASNTLYQVNYVVANNASQTPVTVWDAIYTTIRTTTFNTSNTTATSFVTTFATTRDTTQTTTTSFTTSFDTSQSTTTTFSTSANTTTTFSTSKNTTTSFNTSRSTTTTYNTNRSTSRTTTGAYSGYSYSAIGNSNVTVWHYNGMNSIQLYWNGNNEGAAVGGYTHSVVDNTTPLTITKSTYTFNRGTLQSSVTGKYATDYYYSLRRRLNSVTTTFTTTFSTSKSTTTTFSTGVSTTTTFNTSASTATTFNTSASTNTALGTSATTSANTTTTFSTSFDTTNTTSQDTTTTFSTSNDTTVYERVTATGAETEVSSAGAHNIRHWDGNQWTEE